ncbi:MAG TPA: N-acyl homoserine lactonase family protein [bacterium]|nr:N-acyl homoserine lactonase family protein [bacterium]
MSESDTYEVYAVKYGTKQDRLRAETLILADHHDAPMPIDYFVWAIVNAQRTIVVDTGFDRAEGERRGRTLLREPREGLALLGIDAATVRDVVVTHMHYDHAGNLADFPAARFHVNDHEMAFTTGRHMLHASFRRSFAVEHVCGMVRRVFDGQVVFHQGEETLVPGISLHHIGGHTPGMMSVRVKTRRGWIVLASDACHFYEELERGLPFVTVFHVGDMLEGLGRLQRLGDSPQHIVPGHDPLVMQRYSAPRPELEGIAVRLDVAPQA